MHSDFSDSELLVLSVPAFTNCRKGIPILKEKRVEVEVEVEVGEVTVLNFERQTTSKITQRATLLLSETIT